MQDDKETLETPTANEEQAVESEINTENDEDDEVEFDDGEVANEPDEKKTNRNNAKQRLERKKAREQKRLEEENRIRKQAHADGFKEASNNINRFTGEPLETDEDIDAFKLMLEIEKDGGDPLEDFYKYSIKKQKLAREEKEKAEKEQKDALELAEKTKKEKEEFISRDIEDFQKNHSNVNLKDLLNDTDFNELFGDDLGIKPLATLYDKYQKIQGRIQKVKVDKAIQNQAINMSSTGALGNNANPPKVDFDKMTRDEFIEWKKKNIRN